METAREELRWRCRGACSDDLVSVRSMFEGVRATDQKDYAPGSYDESEVALVKSR